MFLVYTKRLCVPSPWWSRHFIYRKTKKEKDHPWSPQLPGNWKPLTSKVWFKLLGFLASGLTFFLVHSTQHFIFNVERHEFVFYLNNWGFCSEILAVLLHCFQRWFFFFFFLVMYIISDCQLRKSSLVPSERLSSGTIFFKVVHWWPTFTLLKCRFYS